MNGKDVVDVNVDARIIGGSAVTSSSDFGNSCAYGGKVRHARLAVFSHGPMARME